MTVLFLAFQSSCHFFSCVIAVARAFSTVLDRSAYNECPYLSDHREKAFNISPLKMMLLILVCGEDFCFCVLNGYSNFCQVTSQPCDYHMIFLLHSFNVLNCIN